MRIYPEPMIIQTLFGLDVLMIKCNTCMIEKPNYEFYVETPSKLKKYSRYKEQSRNQCIQCWKLHKGRVRGSKNKNSFVCD